MSIFIVFQYCLQLINICLTRTKIHLYSHKSFPLQISSNYSLCSVDFYIYVHLCLFYYNIRFPKAISDSYFLSNLRCHSYLFVGSYGNTVSGYTFMRNLHEYLSKQITRYIYVSMIVNHTVPISVPPLPSA